MSIPQECAVLVVGGGPAGSYAAAVLAREGINTVLLEADVFPRYHVGESMLPSLRHFLRFIDLDETFDKHGFQPKRGAAFRLSKDFPVAYTDFIEAGGPDAHAWNVVRSEADHLMFKHAEKSGAKTFDGTKVRTLEFDPVDASQDPELPPLGRATSASWSCKDGRSGTIKFQYVIDASGRAGLVSTSYLKNRKYNSGLKNVASWGYWKNVGDFGVGTKMEGQPYFVALEDGSGWIWTIRLHNGTTSVGVVINQEVSTRKKKEMDLSSRDFYTHMVQTTPGIVDLCKDAELVSDIKYAADWSYSASHYASLNTRIAGDAGCFIDPYFSSGVHLAVASGLSAATSICAAIRGDCDEGTAAKWHTAKVSIGYTRFLLVVMSALKQITRQETLILGDVDEKSFDRAFSLFRPIIQGTAEVSTKLTQADITQTVDFCVQAFHPAGPAEREAVAQKLSETSSMPEMSLSEDERRVLTTMKARNAIRSEDLVNIENFRADVINGMVMNLERGELGLSKAASDPVLAELRSGESGVMCTVEPMQDSKVSIFSY